MPKQDLYVYFSKTITEKGYDEETPTGRYEGSAEKFLYTSQEYEVGFIEKLDTIKEFLVENKE